MPASPSQIDQHWQSHTEFYYDAFSESYRRLWSGIDAVAMDKEELYQLAYYRALTCFLDDDYDSIIDRRILLYAYLASTFSTTSADDTLRRHRKMLPTDSTVRRVVRNICTAYDEPPQRTFSDSDAVNELMTTLYDRLRIDTVLPDAYHRARLCGIVAVRPRYTNGRWSLTVLTPDQFRVITDPMDASTATAVMYPLATADGVKYVRWTAFEYSDGGAPQVNPYGRLPFVFLRLSEPHTFFAPGMMTLVERQLDVNKLKFLSDLNATYAGAPIWLATNIPKSELRLSPDRIISTDGVTQGEGQDVPPMLDPVTPDDTYTSLQDLARDRERAMMMANGIPYSMVASDAGAPPSGIARVIERQEIIELRNADQKYLRQFEQDLAELIAVVARQDAGTAVAPEQVSMSLTFSEEAPFIEPKDEYEFDKMKAADGALAAEDFFRKWGDINGDDVTLEEIISQRRSQWQTLMGTAPTDTL